MITKSLLTFLSLISLSYGFEQSYTGSYAEGHDDTVAKRAISEVLTRRCEIMAKERSGSFCALTAIHLAEELDTRGMAWTNSTKVHFTSDLIELNSSDQAVTYLRGLKKKLKSLTSVKETLNLWDYTLSAAGGDKGLALKWLAVLFGHMWGEDALKLVDPHHIRYLKGLGPESFRMINELRTSIYFLTDSATSAYVEFYPKEVMSYQSGNPRFYHFYTTAYLTHKLNQYISGFHAAFLPYLLSYTYEEHMVVTEPQLKIYFTTHIKNIWDMDQLVYFLAVGDIYLDYLATFWAISSLDKVVDEESFRENFSSGSIEYSYKLYESI